MTLALPALYHWAPADRHDSIKANGLVLGSDPTVCTEAIPQICLSPDPRDGWMLSGAMEWVSEVDAWDLWLVDLADTDEVRIRAGFGPDIQEVKVGNSIPASRLWHVGRREA